MFTLKSNLKIIKKCECCEYFGVSTYALSTCYDLDVPYALLRYAVIYKDFLLSHCLFQKYIPLWSFFHIFLKTFLRYKFTEFKFEKRHLNSLSVLKMIKLTTKQLLKIAYHCVSPSYVE